MNIDEAIGANRPLTFVVAESDTELLLHLNRTHRDNFFLVYSESLSGVLPLEQYLSSRGNLVSEEAKTTIMVLDSILTQNVATNFKAGGFTTVVFLDCHTLMTDQQVIRKIKDIMHRYQIDENFTYNMIMVSHRICVPQQLERLSEMVFFELPTEAQLKAQSKKLCKKLQLSGDRIPSEDVVNALRGLTLFEVEQAYLSSLFIYDRIDLNFIRNFKKTSISKTDLLTLLETDITFKNIGGMDRLKAWVVKSAGGWTAEGRKFGLPLLKGLLLVGPPGCGKSLLAKAIGNEWGLPVVNFDFGKVFSSRVGDSESNMRRVLKIFESISPVVVFADEIEKSMAGLGSSDKSDAGTTSRVLSTFLQWFQDSTYPVFIVGTSNNISAMPPELISRFDETFYVHMPQAKERRDIFNIHLQKVNRDPAKFDIDVLADTSKDFSGREIEKIIREAMYDAFAAKMELTTDIILQVISKKTCILKTMAENVKQLFNWVGWDPVKKDGLRARYASIPEDFDQSRVQQEIEKLIAGLDTGATSGT